VTVGEIISKGLLYFEGLDPSDLAQTRNRAQALLLLQQVLFEVENERDLKYLYKDDATLTLASGASTMAPPADYRDMGMEGAIWVPALSRNIDGPKQDEEIFRLRYENGNAPRIIEEFGFWAGLFQFAKADALYTFTLHYLQQSQTIVDSSDPTLVVDDSTVLLMPVQYHHTVLLSGMLSRTNMVKDELRNAQAEVFNRNRAQMFVRERPRRGGPQIWPQQPGVSY
jgi:hypothetical protein